MDIKSKNLGRLKQLAPWAAGASLAVTHIAMSTNCTVTREGHCNTCGSCAVALIALVSWAVMKKGDQEELSSTPHKRI
ncbi:MAG: hypothetical protein HOM14_07165 [Gammaproteobacteria bacterium]|jgi:uncharacterized protein YuzB (UPF0349 family)|nr:hypothetical protein [Gammaproteobacteria bacterium]MBT3722791.1 hypothetical protein [Gammaproteobacteria bacterium]MBT4077354.1 hypothetical protein [Gammaproteobacteria bacterium]MBT4193448.1 hypothetical protein [Gammaproteobacteria bacterium]MBT4450365.1 hypothetical protein [Gammaproteobacteria bacterium]